MTNSCWYAFVDLRFFRDKHTLSSKGLPDNDNDKGGEKCNLYQLKFFSSLQLFYSTSNAIVYSDMACCLALRPEDATLVSYPTSTRPAPFWQALAKSKKAAALCLVLLWIH